jgi:hypothetical protein
MIATIAGGAVVNAPRFEVTDDNEAIVLVVTTTAGECGIDPSTDGSAGDDYPVQLRVDCHRTSDDRARTTLEVWTLGQTLRTALDGREPRWMICDSIERNVIREALDRLAPAWRDWEVDAECQIEAEAEASEDDWLAVLEQRPETVFGVGA